MVTEPIATLPTERLPRLLNEELGPSTVIEPFAVWLWPVLPKKMSELAITVPPLVIDSDPEADPESSPSLIDD